MEVDNEPNSNDKSSESIDSDDNDEALENEVATLNNKISLNAFDYQAHVDLISALKKLVDLDRLRIARNRMADQFPLSSTLWVDWLQDEVKLAISTEEKIKLVELFERAVKDYISVEIWLEYVQFSIGLHTSAEGPDLEKIRNVFERSLTAAGLHVTKGSLLWEAYVEFEIVVLAMLKDKTDESQNQIKRIANLFKRQLSCPLLDIDETFERFNLWLDDSVGSSGDTVIDKKVVENIYKKSKEKLTKITPYEEKLLSDSENLLPNYNEYMEHEKSKAGSPVRVQCLYERAVCDLCLNDTLWLDYIDYVSTVLDNGEVVVDVSKRAIRNCPWSCRLYQSYLRSLEKYRHPHEIITAAMEQALDSGLQTPTDFRDIWMTYLEYLRRLSDAPEISKEEEEKHLQDLIKAFSKATEFLSQLHDADNEGTISQFWARIEAIYSKNMEKSRSLWNDILSDERNKTAEMWSEYINLERAYGDSKHLRKLFPRALQHTKDWPETIAKSWINYERDEGTLESYTNCMSKVQKRLKEVNELREKEARLAEAEKLSEVQPKRSKRAGLGYKEKNARSFNDSETRKPVERKVRSPERKNDTEGRKIIGYKRKADVKETESEVSPSKKSRQDEISSNDTKDIVDRLLNETQKEHGVTVPHDPAKDDRTIFVSNLDFATPESVIRDIFESCGTITDLRLVKDFKGRSKGYCYVEFENHKDAAKALGKDREPVEGRPMFVSKCDPDKETRRTVFKYSSNMEKNKLFIRGLPHSTTEADLRDLFGKYGCLKDVRLVTYRNGHSKGLAYVDFEDEVSAAQAILKTDGMKLGDKEIKVAISNPPGRKTDVTALTQSILSLGGGPKEAGPRGRGRTQISFMPRSLQLTHQSAATSSMANLSIASPVPVDNSKKLSNSDFRSLLK